ADKQMDANSYYHDRSPLSHTDSVTNRLGQWRRRAPLTPSTACERALNPDPCPGSLSPAERGSKSIARDCLESVPAGIVPISRRVADAKDVDEAVICPRYR